MRTNLLLPQVLTCVLALAACGGDDDAAPTATTPTTLDEAVEVVAVDYAFEGLPPEATVGTRLRLRNDADDEVHELIAYRLPDSEDRSAQDLLALPPEELGALLAGPPDLGLLALPGEDGEVVVGGGTLAEAGRYLVFCAIPAGAAPADVQAAIAEAEETDGPPEIAGGPPHFTSGMFGEIAVG